MEEFLNFPGKLIVHCSDVRGIRASTAGVVITTTSGEHYVTGLKFEDAEKEWKRALQAKAGTGPCQAATDEVTTDEVFKKMDDMFKGMDTMFKGMGGMFNSANRVVKVVRKETKSADRKG